MLRWRLLLGAVFIAGLVGLLWLDAKSTMPGVYLLPLALVLTLLATEELLSLMAAVGLRPIAPIVYAGNALIVLAGYAGYFTGDMGIELGWSMMALGVAVVAVFLGEMMRYEQPGRAVASLGSAMLALCYVGVLFSFVVQLRFAGPGGAWGIAALASLVIVVKLGDTGAYTVGRLIGRHKLIPKLSPGKTIEGSLGGLASCILGGWLCGVILMPALAYESLEHEPSTWGWLAYGLVVGIAGMLGDLAESLIKRDVGRKDSSRWMPGFGGVLDLLDSILLAAPVALLFWFLQIVP